MKDMIKLARNHYFAERLKFHRKEYLEMWKVGDIKDPEMFAEMLDDFEYLDMLTAKVYSTFC